MKYRLYNTEQFVYAGKHDLPYLRVTPSGKVEQQGIFRLGGNWTPAPEWAVEWGEQFGDLEIYENDILRVRTIVNEWQRTDPPVLAEAYDECTDTVIKEHHLPVKMVGGVLTACTPSGKEESEEELSWEISAHSVLLMSAPTDRDSLERQLPYCKWDDEIIEYLCAENGLKGLDELLKYLKPSVIGNLNLVRAEQIEEQQ